MTPRDRTVGKIRELFSIMERMAAMEMGEFEYAQAALFHTSVECLERLLDSIADEEGRL